MAALIDSIGSVLLTTAWLILLCTILELISQREPFSWRARWPGFLFALLVPLFALVMTTPLRVFWSWIGVPPLVSLPVAQQFGTAGVVIATLILNDFFVYWEHRFEHRFLWPVHAVHHSVEHLSAATSFSHPLQFVPMFFLITVPLSLIDLGTFEMPPAVLFIAGIVPMVIHSPVGVGLGPLRHVFVDPAYHRVHHSMEERHFDRNFGVMFSFWDRLFGTSVMPCAEEWPRTGIHEARSPRTVAELLLYPWRLWRGAPPATPAPDAADDTPALPPASAEANRQAA